MFKKKLNTIEKKIGIAEADFIKKNTYTYIKLI